MTTATMRRGRRLSLGTFLALTIGGIVLAAVSTATLLGWLTARRLTFDLLEQRAEQSMAALESGLALHLRPVRGQIEGLAQLIAEAQLDPEDHVVAGRVLLAGMASLPELTLLGFITPDMARLSALRGNDGSVELSEGTLRGEPEAVDRLTAMRPSDGARWGEVFYAEALADAVVNIAVAVERDGRPMGYVVAGIATRRLTSMVDELGRQFAITVFMLYGHDRVLAHPGLLATSERGSRRVPLVGLDEVGDPVLARLWQGRPQSLGQPMPADISIRSVRLPDDERWLVLYRSVTGYGDLPWTLGVEVPERDIESTTAGLRRIAMAAVSLPILGLLLALLIARLIARPIQRLTDGVRQVANLEIAQVPLLPPSRVRELDQQVNAFNAMLGTLKAFEAYVPKSLVRRLIRAGSESAEGNGNGGGGGNGGSGRQANGLVTSRERDLTVMFTDIVGFTSLAERLPPSEVAGLLNRHFALLAACVEAEEGTVDKYLGDGMMAFWGAPERTKDRARRACRAALAIRDALAADNLRRRASGRAPVRVRIGIHRGPLLVGNIGAPDRVNYTVVGDAANVAQRLEQLGSQWTDQEEVVILVSDAVVAKIGQDFTIAPAGILAVQGRSEPLSTWRLLGAAVKEEAPPASED